MNEDDRDEFCEVNSLLSEDWEAERSVFLRSWTGELGRSEFVS